MVPLYTQIALETPRKRDSLLVSVDAFIISQLGLKGPFAARFRIGRSGFAHTRPQFSLGQN